MKKAKFILFIGLTIALASVYDITYSRDGNCKWVRMLEENLGVENFMVSSDNQDNLYITGYFYDTITVGPEKLKAKGYIDIFVAKFDHVDNLVWIKQAGGEDIEFCKFVDTDVYNNVYITGMFKGEAHFGNTVISSPKSYDYFTAKYSNAGNLVWVKTQ